MIYFSLLNISLASNIEKFALKFCINNWNIAKIGFTEFLFLNMALFILNLFLTTPLLPVLKIILFLFTNTGSVI